MVDELKTAKIKWIYEEMGKTGIKNLKGRKESEEVLADYFHLQMELDVGCFFESLGKDLKAKEIESLNLLKKISKSKQQKSEKHMFGLYISYEKEHRLPICLSVEFNFGKKSMQSRDEIGVGGYEDYIDLMMDCGYEERVNEIKLKTLFSESQNNTEGWIVALEFQEEIIEALDKVEQLMTKKLQKIFLPEKDEKRG